MNQSSLHLYNEIISDLRGAKPLSQILPSALILSKNLDLKDFEQWIYLEMNGYFNTNPVLTDETTVPPYRIIAGQYVDIYDRVFLVEDPKLNFVNEYRIRESTQMLEEYAKKSKLLKLQDQVFLKLIKDNFGVDVHYFQFNSTSVVGVLNGIKTALLNRLLLIEIDVEKSASNTQEHTSMFEAMNKLHPSIQPVATKLFMGGYYRQALLDTYILLINAVKTKSGRHDLDGVALVQVVFSAKKPIIIISDDPDEQMGFMWLFSGAIMGIRNPNAHKIIEHTDPQKTFEWLAYASALLRKIDNASVEKT